MNTAAARTATSLLLALVVAGAASVSALAAKQDNAAKRDSAAKQDTAEKAPSGPIEVVKGVKYRMAKTKLADRVIRIDDAAGDPAFADGSPATGAPGWADVTAVYVAATTLPRKLQAKMAKDFPPGVSGAFYGNQAEWASGDEAIFVAVEMADRLPADVMGQQVEIGIGGDAATPLQAGTRLDTRAGVERFSLSGVFSNGSFATGTTDVSGRAPGAPIDYYNTESGVFGYYDAKRATWFLLVPAATDSDSVVVSVRSSTAVGEVLDRLELPGGGHFVSLADPAGGWSGKSGLPPLGCRSLETFSADTVADLSDPAGTRIRYSAGVGIAASPDDVPMDSDEQLALLGPAFDLAGTIPVAVTAVGSGQEPTVVQADLAVSAQQDAVSLTLEVPPGQWSFALAEGTELETPAGERIIDHTSLTGGAGLSTGPGLDGLVAGDLSCAGDGSQPAAGATAQPTDDPAGASAVPGTDG
ncbi:MAG TPA: hypothetical protein VK987_05415 [Anaerolineae bacterium]|nr:hypothetical protein [Anaerolineae bacterium]